MTHKEALNKILAAACPSDFDGETRIFKLDLHCETVEIHATLESTVDTIQYSIQEVKFGA